MKISAAHRLPKHPGKCRNLHGHNYRIIASATGTLNDQGMVIDFGDLEALMREVIHKPCDHRYLNEVYPGIDTTAENLALRWLSELWIHDDRVYRVSVWETDNGSAIVEIPANYVIREFIVTAHNDFRPLLLEAYNLLRSDWPEIPFTAFYIADVFREVIHNRRRAIPEYMETRQELLDMVRHDAEAFTAAEAARHETGLDRLGPVSSVQRGDQGL